MACAMAKPMPRLAPATNALFPFSERILSKVFETADWVCGGVLKPIKSGEEIQLDCNIPLRRIRRARSQERMPRFLRRGLALSGFGQPSIPVLRYDSYSYALVSHCRTGRRWCRSGGGSSSQARARKGGAATKDPVRFS